MSIIILNHSYCRGTAFPMNTPVGLTLTTSSSDGLNTPSFVFSNTSVTV